MQKLVEITDIGTVSLIKRRGSRSLRLGFDRDGLVRVSLPFWLPYQSGIDFAISKRDWINKHRPEQTAQLKSGDRIGKAHRIVFDTTKATSRASVRQNVITVSCPSTATPSIIQKVAERGAHKALKQEADQLLPQRLSYLAQQHGFSYNSVQTKRLVSRWGSCSQNREIILNIYLMQLPWDLIDYVILHELVHTEHLNHSKDFWQPYAEFSRLRLGRRNPHQSNYADYQHRKSYSA